MSIILNKFSGRNTHDEHSVSTFVTYMNLIKTVVDFFVGYSYKIVL